jgi:hypothetical protein
MARLLRARNPIDQALMLTAITASIWITNGLAATTALYVGVPLLIELLILQRRTGTFIRAAGGGVAAGAGAFLAIVLDRGPNGSVAQLDQLATPGPATGWFGPGGGAHVHPRVVFEFFAQTDLNSPVALALLGLGVVAVLARRQLLWALAAYALILLAVADTFYSKRLNWLLVWPWAEPDRLLGVAYWVVPLLMAFGLVSVFSLAIQMARLARTWAAITLAGMAVIAGTALAWAPIDDQWTRVFRENVSPYPWLPMTQLSGLSRWVFPILITTFILGGTWISLRFLYLTEPGGRRKAMTSRTWAAVIASFAIGLLSLGLGIGQEMSTYEGALGPRHLVTAADLEVMQSISQSLPSGSRVLSAGSDAGLWVPVVTNDVLLVPDVDAKIAPERPLLAALGEACSDPAAVRRVLGSFDVIVIGDHPLGSGAQAWKATCLAAVPGLKEVAQASSADGTAHAFAVIRPAR